LDVGYVSFSLIVNYANSLKKEICRKYHSLPSFLATGLVFLVGLLWSFKITLLSGAVLDTLVLQPVLVLIPMLILAGFYL
jgi:type IV secretory pathway TrbL component